MSFTGHVQNGQVVLDEPLPLEDGARVEIVATREVMQSPPREKTHYERYESFIGKAVDLPEDFALNHNHYIRGGPKQ